MKYLITILVILLFSLSLFWWNRRRRRKSRMAKRIAAKESSIESSYLEDSAHEEPSSTDTPNPLFATPVVDDAMEMSEQKSAIDGLETEAGENFAPLPVKNIESTLLAETDRTDEVEALAGDQVGGVEALAGKKKEVIPVLKEDAILSLKKPEVTSLFEENSASLALKKRFAGGLSALVGQVQDSLQWSSEPSTLRQAQGSAHTLKPSAKSSGSAVRQAELIIVLYVVTQHSGFPGPDIFDVLADLGLRYGEKQIFHHYGVGEIKVKKPVFSVANMLEPGIFDPQHLSKFVSPGLALFTRLPGPFGGRVAFELMLSNAQQIAELLEGSLEDEKHEPLSPQVINVIRERIANFERRETHLSLRKRFS